MLAVVFWLVVLVVLLPTSSAMHHQPLFDSEIEGNDIEWGLKQALPINSTANLVFATVSSLLQSAPNLRYRNGHTIVPGIVRSGTLLYHGRGDPSIPDMEWAAFDPEPSYIFCRMYSQSHSCWLHTFRVERPLRILYFDGSSAAKIGDGAMDSQDILSWGEIRPDLVRDEGLRIRRLCEWGTKLGLAGFVRTASISEIMLCDFSSLHVVSSQHLKSTPLTGFPEAAPTLRTPLQTFPITSETIDNLRTHGRFSQYPGLTQVQLDLTHLVSFYDSKIAPSLFAVRYGKHRLQHRLLGISQEDISRVKSYLERQISYAAWSSLEYTGDRIDWSTHFHSITNLYGDTLKNIWSLVNSTTASPPQSADERAVDAFRMIEFIVQRFVLHSVSPLGSRGNQLDVSWASSVFRQCALSHTSAITSISLTSSEQLLYYAVEGTTREICRVLTKMWADGVHDGMSSLFEKAGHAHKPKNALALLNTWKLDLGNLMNWLDWGIWLQCRPACNDWELCYLPAWPFTIGNLPHRVWRADDPRPRCLRKTAPFIYADEFRD